MVLPNFLIAGAAASGTSFLSSILMQHTDIYLPKEMRPEPHFFYYSDKYAHGVEWYKKKWFSDVKKQSAVGERSSSYLYHKESAKRISQNLPNIKLIFVLRNPIERTWANYRYTVLSGLEDLSFTDALETESHRVKNASGIWKEVQPHDYTGRGLYGEQLEFYLNFFSWSQILIINSEKLSSETQIQLDRITNFLGVKNLEQFEYPPAFTSLSILNKDVQIKCRKLLGANKFNCIVEAVRRKEFNVDDFSEDNKEKKVIKSLSNNMVNEKYKIPEKNYEWLADFFRKDQEKFFNISKNYIDFKRWL